MRVAAHLLGRAKGSAWPSASCKPRPGRRVATRHHSRRSATSSEPSRSPRVRCAAGRCARRRRPGLCGGAPRAGRGGEQRPIPPRPRPPAGRRCNKSRCERAAIVYDHGLRRAHRLRDGRRMVELQAGSRSRRRSSTGCDRGRWSGSAPQQRSRPLARRTRRQRLLLAQAALHASLAGEPVIGPRRARVGLGRLLRRDTRAHGMAAPRQLNLHERRARALDPGSPTRCWPRRSTRARPWPSQPRACPSHARALAGSDHRGAGRPRAGAQHAQRWRRFMRSAAANYCCADTRPAPSRGAVRGRATRAGDRPRGRAPAPRWPSSGSPRSARRGLSRPRSPPAPRSSARARVGLLPWRSAPQAALAMGKREQARELARAALQLSERAGALPDPRPAHARSVRTGRGRPRAPAPGDRAAGRGPTRLERAGRLRRGAAARQPTHRGPRASADGGRPGPARWSDRAARRRRSAAARRIAPVRPR